MKMLKNDIFRHEQRDSSRYFVVELCSDILDFSIYTNSNILEQAIMHRLVDDDMLISIFIRGLFNRLLLEFIWDNQTFCVNLRQILKKTPPTFCI